MTMLSPPEKKKFELTEKRVKDKVYAILSPATEESVQRYQDMYPVQGYGFFLSVDYYEECAVVVRWGSCD